MWKSMTKFNPMGAKHIVLLYQRRASSQVKPKAVLTHAEAVLEAEKCLLCVDAPCASACPASTQPDKFLRQLRFDNPVGGAITVLDNNPLGGICGQVCPVSHLCEGACVRGKFDHPVQIGAVQKYLHDFGIEHGVESPPCSPSSSTQHKVAIVGAGPGGLAAARELRRRGAEVTIFEQHSDSGGALKHALSPFRIDHDTVQEEVQRITDMGVTIQTNHRVNSVHELFEQGFDDVFVAPGLQDSRDVALRIPEGVKREDRVVSALSYLYSANTDVIKAREMSSSKHVTVIGGGSVALDCAITAKALGAVSVNVVAVESMENLPADRDEIAQAHDLGIVFHPQMRVSGLGVKHTVLLEGAPDTSGDSFCIDGCILSSTVIIAAGQKLDCDGENLVYNAAGSTDLKLVSTLEDEMSTRGETQRDNSSHVRVYYAGGDAMTAGGSTVVSAVANGKRAAHLILPNVIPPTREKVSLTTDFCGVQFENPFCLSSSPVTNSADMIAEAYDHGWAGAYYKTLNREDKFHISHPSPRLNAVHSSHGVNRRMGVGIQNVEQISDRPLVDNLADIEWLRKKYPTKVTAVSIMGYDVDDWAYLAAAAEGAGAHLIELNFSCPQMARPDAGHHIGQQFGLIEKYTAAARRAVSIPVIAKMTPNITDMVPAALAAQNGGADGISAINTIKAISHVDLMRNTLMPSVQGKGIISGFSGRAGRPVGLRFVAELAQEERLTIPISGMGGIYTWQDGAEFLSVGASNLQATTSVMQHGYRIVEDMIDGLQHHMKATGASSVQDMVGGALESIVSPAELDTKTEVVSVIDMDKCIGCGACVVACRDGAAQAISMSNSQQTTGKRNVVVDNEKCVGCKLCEIVCPVGAVTFTTRNRIVRERFFKTI